jgi:hypothetical protein
LIILITRSRVNLYYLLQAAISVLIIGGFLSIQAIDGFAIWPKGGGCERELTITELRDMKPAGTKVAVPKSGGADIWPVISFDGKWIAWCRAETPFIGKYGACDYHVWHNWNIYIANIDGGKIIPATPIKVSKGYLPQWGDDSKGTNKTLYFTNYSTQHIMKTVVKPDGSFSDPTIHAKNHSKMSQNGHKQGSPDGKYIAYRTTGIQVRSNKTGKLLPGSGGSGFHPHWGPRSKYLLWAKGNVCRIEGGRTTMPAKNSGLGAYWQGFSNDAYYDEGRIWVIGTVEENLLDQNSAGDNQYKEVDISSGGYKVKEGISLGKGTGGDIHIWRDNTSVLPKTNQKLGNEINFSTLITRNASGLQLIIKSEELSSGCQVTVYDLQGKKHAFMHISGSLENMLPLDNFADGRYIIKLTNNINFMACRNCLIKIYLFDGLRIAIMANEIALFFLSMLSHLIFLFSAVINTLCFKESHFALYNIFSEIFFIFVRIDHIPIQEELCFFLKQD